MITNSQVYQIARRFNIDLSVVPFSELKTGLTIELEHGKQGGPLTNITNDDLDKTARIVLAHIREDPHYYRYLKPLESKRAKYWKHHRKPSIFLLYKKHAQKLIKGGEIRAGNNSHRLKSELKKITDQLSQVGL